MRMRHPSLVASAIRNNPAPTTTAPMARATRSPAGARRSTVMAAATTAIARRFITPTTGGSPSAGLGSRAATLIANSPVKKFACPMAAQRAQMTFRCASDAKSEGVVWGICGDLCCSAVLSGDKRNGYHRAPVLGSSNLSIKSEPRSLSDLTVARQ
jgi:hypothetical protein